jgi:hypothetical protein
MVTISGQDHITETDIAAFAEKLGACARTMPPGEQALLHRLISRAATVRADFTAGYNSYPLELVGRPDGEPDPKALNRALGLTLGGRL